jgi:hypothetical protein
MEKKREYVRNFMQDRPIPDKTRAEPGKVTPGGLPGFQLAGTAARFGKGLDLQMADRMPAAAKFDYL